MKYGHFKLVYALCNYIVSLNVNYMFLNKKKKCLNPLFVMTSRRNGYSQNFKE